MAVSVVTIFAAAALLAIAASSLIAWQLQSYVDNNDNLSSSLSSQNDALHLSSASLQLSRMNDFLLREVQRMRLSTNETQRMVLAEANTPLIRTSAGALSAVNRTMFNSFAHRVTYGEELYGFAVNFLYPADTDNVTSVQSIQVYADPLFDGSLQPIHAWTDPSSGQTSAYQIDLVSSGVVTASGDNTIPIVDTSMEQYDFNYLASAQIGIGYASRFDMLPWQSSDGNPWWFLQQCASLKMQGVNTVVQTYASTVYWEQKLTALLTTPDAYFVLFTKDLIVIASSYPAFKSQRNACIKSSSGAALVNCISATLTSNDSQPIFQYIGAHVIPNAASTGHLVANTNDTHYIRMVLPGSGGVNTVVVVPPPIQLEGPTGEQLGLVWFQVGDAAALSQSSTASSSTVPALIAMIVIVAVLSTAGVGGLVHRSFIAPMDVMIEQMIAVTELDMEAIDAVAATRETAPHNNGGQLTASSSEGRSGANFAEMNLLQHAFAKMAASMQLFLLYLPREVVRDLMTTGHTAKQGGAMVVQELTERRLTVLFADIVNFTSATAALRQSVDVFVELLQLYFEQATTALLEEGCTIDKYIGDAIMGFWGAPLDCPEQCSLGCEGALRLADEVDRMKPEFAAHGWDLAVRIGVHSGPAMVGSIGSKRRLNFTALGNTVNVASRIEGLCKTTKTPINITSAVFEGLPASTSTKNASVVVSEFVVRGLGLFVLKGTNEPIPVFQLCGYARQTTRPMLSRRRSTASGNTSRRSDMQSSARMRLHSSAVEMQAPRDYVKKVFSQDSIQVIQKLHDAQAAFDEGNLAVSLTHFQDAHKSLVDGLQTIDADALRHVNIHAARLDEIIAGVAQRLAYQHEHPSQRFDPVVWMNDK